MSASAYEPSRPLAWLLLAVLLAGCWTLVADRLADREYTAEATELVEQADSRAIRTLGNIERGLRRTTGLLRGIAFTLARDSAIQAVLADAERLAPKTAAARERQWQDEPRLAAVNAQLAAAVSDLGVVSVAWVLDLAGDCIAASNPGQPDSFIGVNFGDREYFAEALAGGPGRQFAVGRKTNIPGLYFSAPVSVGGRIVGVIAVKVELEFLGLWLERVADAFISDDYDVVVIARDPALLMRTLPEPGVTALDRPSRLARYRREQFEPLRLTLWGDNQFPHLRRFDDGAAPHLIHSRRLADEGFTVTVSTALPQLLTLQTERQGHFLLLSAVGALTLVVAAGGLWYVVSRRAMRAALAERAEWLRVLFNNSADAILVVPTDPQTGTPSGTFVEVNETACTRLGYSREELLAMTPEQISEPVGDACDARLATDNPALFQRIQVTRDGRRIPIEISAHTFQLRGRTMMLAVARNITERRRMEEAERRQRASLRHLSEIAAFSHLPLDEQLRQALGIGAAQFELEFGIVSEISGDRYRVISQVSPPDTLSDGQTFDLGSTYCSITIASGEVLAIDDMAGSAYVGHPCYRAFALETYIGAPIVVDGAVFGTVNFSSPRRYHREFDENDREFIALLARWAGSAIERDRQRQRLVESELKLQTIIDTEPECVKVLAPDGMLLQMNRAGLAMIEADRPEQVIGQKVAGIVMAPYRKAFMALTRRVAHGASGTLQFEVMGLKGTRRWLESHAVPLPDATGRIVGVLAVTRDVTERKRSEQELRIAAAAFESQEPILITDADQNIQRVNHAFCEVTGYAPDEVIGRTPRLLRSGRHDRAFYAALWQTLQERGHWQGEMWSRRKNGETFPEWLTITAVKDAGGCVTHYVGVFQDITGRKAADEKIRQLAFYDPLTGLPNRRLLIDRLQQAVAAGERSGHHGALMFIDLDNFKVLNDTLGHDAGDRLLKEVGVRLCDGLRATDTVARLGGDEFVIMLQNLGTGRPEAGANAERVGLKILDTLNEPYLLAGQEFHSTGSLGITLFRDRDDSAEELLKRADLAMYQAKASGRNAVRFFDPAMQHALDARSLLESDLRRALRHDEFVLHFQLQVNREGRPIGAEALVRWQHPARGLIFPGDFISVAEETGLIVPLGRLVLEKACRALTEWRHHPVTAFFHLSVNVSVKQFRHPDFVAHVRGTIEEAGIDPCQLVLELTESMLVSDVDDTIEKMESLRELGLHFSLDDFGTGYSSLSYLKRLPLEQLKIDRSFVRDMLDDPSDSAIVDTIIALGNTLGLKVIAEGVESDQQYEYLVRNGCHFFQGYLFGRPAAEVRGLSQRRRSF